MNLPKLLGPLMGIVALGGVCLAVRQIDESSKEAGGGFQNQVGTKKEGSRREALVQLLAAAPNALRELPNGYSLTYDGGQKLLPIAAEWVGLESRRCPFLELSIAVMRDQGPLVIKVTGAQGIKAFLRQEIGPMLRRPPEDRAATGRRR